MERPGPGRARHPRPGLAVPSASCPTSRISAQDQTSVSRSLKWEGGHTELHYCIIKMTLWGSRHCLLTFPHSCHFPSVLQAVARAQL